MAKPKAQATPVRIERDVNRPGIHAKTKQSKIKTSKLYKKPYKGQGGRGQFGFTTLRRRGFLMQL